MVKIILFTHWSFDTEKKNFFIALQLAPSILHTQFRMPLIEVLHTQVRMAN